KCANKNARISVKLVSEAGVGTVAAGVAKAGAGVILISGYDGGTGAAPLSSIHNAGLPWELGLAETHQTLIANGLRNKVVIETDGKLMSGRDVAIAAILGAEEFGFATAPLVTMGCVMMRACQSDTCPMGVATQNPELRKRFKGKPEYVENFMRFIASDLRELMSRLGVRTIDELVGRTDLLNVKKNLDTTSVKLDLSKVLLQDFDKTLPHSPKSLYDFELEKTKDESKLLSMKDVAKAIKNGTKATAEVELKSVDRTFGTLLGAEITRNNLDGLEEDTITVNCIGAGGQSFGAFIPRGLTLSLSGDSNDYFGKGLSGGKLVVKTPKEATYDPHDNVIIGNVALYGATSGKAFIAGRAGERFCIRNSGATACVEGVGEHGCEYMTGGVAVILGPIGKNFAAGMSGGVAYVHDPKNKLYKNLNKELVAMENVESKVDKEELKAIIEEHVQLTDSKKGKEILDGFDENVKHFKKIIPTDYKIIMKEIAHQKEHGADDDTAKIEAFKVVAGGEN
ncbi:MAG: glutamate synthase subunit alpha, partial [Lachnospiraceae bacterium]|nr:glutamate synthase subunit alpha [Lachnospiraceae bacterium]